MTHRVLTAALFVAASAFTAQAHAQSTKPAADAATASATAPAPAAAPDPGAAFLAKNAKEPGILTTASGLQYKVLHSGPTDGASPKTGDEVQVVYEGKLLNGKVFDSSTDDNPASLEVGQLVPGWNEALQMMKPGDEWILFIPPNLGYGSEDKGPIPGNSVMIFRMKLLAIGPLS
jgi:peptidylprolyl isomerase/FKBP-type peptidyl-prolyl cis-trans isomerase FklB